MDTLAVGKIAQIVLDLYMQDFAQEGSFLQLEHINLLLETALAEKLNMDFKEQKLITKAQSGFSWVETSSDMLVRKDIDVSVEDGDYFVTLPSKPFAFEYDSLGSAVQRVVPVGCKCGDLIRISIDDESSVCMMPKADKVFYLLEENKIRFVGPGRMPTKVRASYIPALDFTDDDATMPKTKAEYLIDKVLQKLLIAKNGVVIDKTNDGNPNVLPQTEVNTDGIKA